MGAHIVLLGRKDQPDRWTRSRNFWVGRAGSWNFHGDHVSGIYMGCVNLTYLNYWNSFTCANGSPGMVDDRLTRGGPIARQPAYESVNTGVSTDSRKWISFGLNGGHSSNSFGGWGGDGGIDVTVKPTGGLTISMGPSYSHSRGEAQYVETDDDPSAVRTFGKRYVFAPIDQKQLSMTTRVNWIVSPRMSLRVYMQPLLATGDYQEFEAFAAPGTFDFTPLTPEQITFDNPDYNFKSLRLNSVFRWEFKPGSTLYAVWTQQREDDQNPGQFRLGRDAGRLFSSPANDIFLVKMTYWIGR
jgi:hypothetical protein